MKKINIALIGLGHLGKWHYQKLLSFPEVQVVAIVENNPQTKKKVEDNFPQQKVVSSLDEIINEIDAAFVVTPTSFHYSLVKELLSQGKHVFCEKPLSTSYLHSKELHELAQKNKLKLQVGHSERFHFAWDYIKTHNLNHYIEKSEMTSFMRHGTFKGRAFDVDVIQDLMIHDLDLVTFLLADWPIKLFAFGTKICSSLWDHVETILFFANGKKVHLSAARNFSLEKRNVYFSGPAGSLEVDLIKHELTYSSPLSAPSEAFSFSKNDHLLIEQQHFVNSLKNNRPVVVDSYQGARINYLIDQINESLIQNKEIDLLKL